MAYPAGPKGEIKFEIKEQLGVISSGRSGWNKELNLVSWNGGEAKYDLREWDEKHERMGKGITLTSDELKTLFELIGRRLNGVGN